MNSRLVLVLMFSYAFLWTMDSCSNRHPNADSVKTDFEDSVRRSQDSIRNLTYRANDSVNFKFILQFIDDVVYKGNLGQEPYEKYFVSDSALEKSFMDASEKGLLQPYNYSQKNNSITIEYFRWNILSSCISIDSKFDSIHVDKREELGTTYKLQFKCGEAFYVHIITIGGSPKIINFTDKGRMSFLPSRRWMRAT